MVYKVLLDLIKWGKVEELPIKLLIGTLKWVVMAQQTLYELLENSLLIF